MEVLRVSAATTANKHQVRRRCEPVKKPPQRGWNLSVRLKDFEVVMPTTQGQRLGHRFVEEVVGFPEPEERVALTIGNDLPGKQHRTVTIVGNRHNVADDPRVISARALAVEVVISELHRTFSVELLRSDATEQ